MHYPVTKLNFRPWSVGSLVNEVTIAPGYRAAWCERQPDTVDSFAKLDDFSEWLRMGKQFEVGVRPNQTDLSCPSQK